jgi:hypothetical protein
LLPFNLLCIISTHAHQLLYFQIDLSATSETDPFKPITITPTKGKRAAAEPEISHGKNVEPSPPQLSSTRLRSKIKIEKNP